MVWLHHMDVIGMRVAIREGVTGLHPLWPEGIFCFSHLRSEPPGPPMAAVSSEYCTGRQRLKQWGKPTAAALKAPCELQGDGCSNVSGGLSSVS